MIRNASKIWGYPDAQDINSFDPVLGLMIGALAEELHNISREINRSDARVIDKFLDILFTQNVFTHFPAHAIAYAEPAQPQVSVNEFYQFYYTKEVRGLDAGEGKSEKRNIFFSPATRCALFDGKIKYLFAGNHLYELDGRLKEIIAETPRKSPSGGRQLLLGIQVNPLIEFLDGLSLFFSFKNIRPESRFYHNLQSSKWKINGKEVAFYNGMETELAQSENSLASLIKKENDISYRTGSFIQEYYNGKFMTLDKGNYRLADFLQAGNEPYILKENFQDQKNIFNQDIIWVEVTLSQPISFEEVNDLVISMNSFPVINRELNEYTHSVVKGVNVIPLLTDDLFFDLRKVTDSENNVYSPRSSSESNEEEGRSCYIRQGGIARFDSRDAKEAIKHLIALARDEAAAFSLKGADLISYELKQLDQILARLEQRIDTSDIAQGQNSYLILESAAEYDKIQVQFWAIAGDRANNIRPGSKLMVYKGIDLNDNSVVLLTQTVGGRQKLSQEDKLNTLRRSLLSKGRIVTMEDIKALCFELLGKDLKNAEVKKGVALDYSPGKGMTRTLDIFLRLATDNELTPEDISHKTESLKVRLRKESVNLLPYRVFVE